MSEQWLIESKWKNRALCEAVGKLREEELEETLYSADSDRLEEPEDDIPR